ncbi:hypothetical protein BD410DRAFT_468340 [Rickenella mellea]|uniref:Uncharacterized protein n=1 Tax=Rickenella mellea TaxID=50990 RepID=A0A4Y7PUT9_9AGAM|nr:hypothetical protein BD410DRAFT_468340 [Rickenella mellea]
MASIKEDLSGSGEKVERALADKETAERAADSLHEVIKNCEANISSLSRDVEREQSERSNMAVKLSTALRARSTLKVEVVGKDNDIRRLQDELKTVRESERSLHATLRDVVAQNSAEADRASEREVANVKVEQQLRDTRKELEAMRSKVQEMEASLKNNEEARREATAALAQLEIKLSAVQSQCENMAVDLSSAIKRAQNAEELGESLQETRKLDAEVLRCLKTMYAKMRDAQKEHLREMDEKVRLSLDLSFCAAKIRD